MTSVSPSQAQEKRDKLQQDALSWIDFIKEQSTSDANKAILEELKDELKKELDFKLNLDDISWSFDVNNLKDVDISKLAYVLTKYVYLNIANDPENKNILQYLHIEISDKLGLELTQIMTIDETSRKVTINTDGIDEDKVAKLKNILFKHLVKSKITLQKNKESSEKEESKNVIDGTVSWVKSKINNLIPWIENQGVWGKIWSISKYCWKKIKILTKNIFKTDNESKKGIKLDLYNHPNYKAFTDLISVRVPWKLTKTQMAQNLAVWTAKVLQKWAVWAVKTVWSLASKKEKKEEWWTGWSWWDEANTDNNTNSETSKINEAELLESENERKRNEVNLELEIKTAKLAVKFFDSTMIEVIKKEDFTERDFWMRIMKFEKDHRNFRVRNFYNEAMYGPLHIHLFNIAKEIIQDRRKRRFSEELYDVMENKDKNKEKKDSFELKMYEKGLSEQDIDSIKNLDENNVKELEKSVKILKREVYLLKKKGVKNLNNSEKEKLKNKSIELEKKQKEHKLYKTNKTTEFLWKLEKLLNKFEIREFTFKQIEEIRKLKKSLDIEKIKAYLENIQNENKRDNHDVETWKNENSRHYEETSEEEKVSDSVNYNEALAVAVNLLRSSSEYSSFKN